MTMVTVWHGTEQEMRALLTAVNRNCEEGCDRSDRCPTHNMLLQQRNLDDLLFARRLRHRFIREEHSDVR